MENKIIYSILFLKGRNGTNINELADHLDTTTSEVKQMLVSLNDELERLDWPLKIVQTETKIRLTLAKETSIELSKTMKKNINISLTKSLLEALTIVAYKQPTTKSDIENIRGVSADYAITKLLEYELVKSDGRSDLPGKPRLYRTTDNFLELFELTSIDDLPKVSTEFEEKTKKTTLFVYDEDNSEFDISEKDEGE